MINWSSCTRWALLNIEGFLTNIVSISVWVLWIRNNHVIMVTWIINWNRQEINKHVRCLLLTNCPFFFFCLSCGHKKIDNLILTDSFLFSVDKHVHRKWHRWVTITSMNELTCIITEKKERKFIDKIIGKWHIV
jgi:hypothetical protein